MIELILAVIAVFEAVVILYFWVKSKRYNGQMYVTVEEDGTKLFNLNLDDDPMTLVDKNAISFKVVTDIKS